MNFLENIVEIHVFVYYPVEKNDNFCKFQILFFPRLKKCVI